MKAAQLIAALQKLQPDQDVQIRFTSSFPQGDPEFVEVFTFLGAYHPLRCLMYDGFQKQDAAYLIVEDKPDCTHGSFRVRK